MKSVAESTGYGTAVYSTLKADLPAVGDSDEQLITSFLGGVPAPLGFLLVGFCWGTGSALMKRGLEYAGQVGPDPRAGRVKKALQNLACFLFGSGGYRFLHWRAWLPYFFDQIGSISFMFLLGHNDIKIAVPVTNALAIFFTFVTELFLFRTHPEKRAILGGCLVFLGAYWCSSQ